MTGARGKSIFELRKDGKQKNVFVLEARNDCQEMRTATLTTLLLVFYGFYGCKANYHAQSTPASWILK